MAICIRCGIRPTRERPKTLLKLTQYCGRCINNARRDLRIRGIPRTTATLLARLRGGALPKRGKAPASPPARPTKPEPVAPVEAIYVAVPAGVVELHGRAGELVGDDRRILLALHGLEHAVVFALDTPIAWPDGISRALRRLRRELRALPAPEVYP